jgi:hypothetical protein
LNTGICAIISKTRLHQALAMIESIINYNSSYQFYLFCVDDESYELLSRMTLKRTTVIKDSNINNKMLIEAKQERKLSQYCWTLKPYAILHIFNEFDNIHRVIYVDTDIYFYSDPETIFKNAPKWSVLYTTHKVNNLANGGFVCFKRDRTGLSALEWWKKQCIKWCSEYYDEHGNLGDQGYLNSFKQMYSKIHCSKRPGVNVAPWNQHLLEFEYIDGKIYVNGTRLIFFHFSCLRMFNKWDYWIGFDVTPISYIYEPYIDVLRKKIDVIETLSPGFSNNLFLGI